MNVRYRITLTPDEREQLRALVQAGKGRVRRLKRAQILLASSAGWSARLRYALDALTPKLKQHAPHIVKVRVRVSPAGR